MKRTDAQNALLWKHLDGVTEFKHDEDASSAYMNLGCSKCETFSHKRNADQNDTCPIPDKYEGTDADIAEKIRVWMKKLDRHKQKNYELSIDYALEVGKDYEFSELTVEVMTNTDWLILGLNTSPADKIAAFIEVVKSLSP